ncbi:hypothetical protein GCM10023090_22830 [Acidovorax lacteus]|uniref:Uncharacterized protein n=1 Tax=Acidovorax lacteus TaxID=1924988 RepID=A0ABP8LBL3_9BURK
MLAASIIIGVELDDEMFGGTALVGIEVSGGSAFTMDTEKTPAATTANGRTRNALKSFMVTFPFVLTYLAAKGLRTW